MITVDENTLDTKPRYEYTQNPLAFVNQTFVALSHAQSAEDLADLVEDLLQANTLTLLEDNAQLYLPLSYAISFSIRRVVFMPAEIRFPNLLLLLPPIFHTLGWCHDSNEEWDEVHEETLKRFEQFPGIHDAIMLLFIEGMKFNPLEAMMMFQSRTCLMRSLRERHQAQALEKELREYDWPEVSRRYIA
ncbi:MAG: hypothetical protein OEZ43_09810 [Gammaproteobacteria bacterium]|nr:hypothetical protein [Gammaproteobacteria bacterium]